MAKKTIAQKDESEKKSSTPINKRKFDQSKSEIKSDKKLKVNENVKVSAI